MRVVLIAHGFPPFAGGGAEIYAHAHATELARRGDKIFVITREADSRRPEYSVRHERRPDMDVAWINNTWAAVTSFEDSYQNERINAIAAELIDAFSPDVAHVHHLTCLSTLIVQTLRSRRVPIFLTLHDYWLLCHRGQLLDVNVKRCAGPEPNGCGACLGDAAMATPGLYAARAALSRVLTVLPAAALSPLRRLAAGVGQLTAPDRAAEASKARLDHMRSVMDGVTHFLAPSQSVRDRFVAFGIDPARISVSDLGFAKATSPKLRLNAPAKPLRIGYLGSLMVSKAPHLLIEACEGLPSGTATVDLWGESADYHGDSSYRAVMAQWLSTPGVRAHGRIASHEVSSIFDQIDVLAMPSIWPETSGMVIREAFLAGVPVVASRIGAIPEAVTDGVNGLLFEPGDVDDLRRVLVRLVHEPDLLPRLRQGIPPVRTIADDVSGTRERYVAALTAPAPQKRLAAVVLNYRTPDETFLAARSLLLSERPPDEVIVVDNDRSPACERALAPIRDRVRYIRTGRNLGFSGGMNAGIREALDRGADRILLVNSDAIVPHDCIARLERSIDSSPRAGIAGPVLLARHAPDRVASAGMSYDARTGRMRHRAVGAVADTIPSRTVDVTAVSGTVMLVTREVFEKVGLFDEDYFFSFEDLDFCLRARAAGQAVMLAGGAVAFHEGGQSMGPRSTRRLYFGARNHLLVAKRTAPDDSAVSRASRAAVVVGLNLAHAVRAPGGTAWSRCGAVLRGTRDYVFGRFGPDAVGAGAADES